MMTSPTECIAGAAILAAALASVIHAGPPSESDIKKALVAWADEKVFSLDPINNKLQTSIVENKKGSLIAMGETFTALEVAKQLKVCKNFHSKCEAVINQAILKYEILQTTASCAAMAEDLSGDADSWCSLDQKAKILRWLIKYLQRQYLHCRRGTATTAYASNYARFVDGDKCVKILAGGISQKEKLVSVAEIAKDIPECKKFVSNCATIIQEFADSKKNDGISYSCHDLTLATKNGLGGVLCSASDFADIKWS